MHIKLIQLFLRYSLAIGFLSAVADRFGLWPEEQSAWGNWNTFLHYTHILTPWLPKSLIPVIGIIATAAEISFALCLMVGFKTRLFAKLSGILLLIFAFSMTLFTGIKGALDYSVFSAAAAAFALSCFKEYYFEIDSFIYK
ncbi:DoxX family protein [Seonamhaeicola marinus]|uniref:DoxX family protein n=1 Tax=Seonamhaeicola marinus TaxID=1912246 RepID=A0A5D0JB50_9FLAO|nr:DoxX family protein [Seonamhaeicola marinus]TYA92330.1 DoxX family protein [Seonamhaeicola marinus]